MTDETETTSEVARVLGEHYPDQTSYDAGDPYWAHQAVVLAEAGLLREAKRATGGPVTGKSQIVGLPEGGCEYLVPLAEQPKRRLRECVENWPEAETGAYDPSCCRFPKSCSATVYDEGRVTEGDLEPREATQAPAEQPHTPSGGNGTGGGLGERLRLLARNLGYPGAQTALQGMAAEVDEAEAAYRVADAEIARLSEFHDHYRAQVERVRAQLVRMTKSSDEGTRRHGKALLGILDGEAS